MKAFLINPLDETITEVDHDNSDYKNISKAIDAKYFTTVQIHEDGDTIYLDDEGLLHGNHKHTFTLDKVFGQTFVGKGLVLGTNMRNGDAKDVDCTLDDLKNRIEFNKLQIYMRG
tara:strand:- start:438 stop:782 length:345 start_codon:yes stop_codon:yes gene_type:complete